MRPYELVIRTSEPNRTSEHGEHALRKIPRRVEKEILRRWLEGYTQRQAAREFRVGLATVNRVINDARKRTPDLDELRRLNVMLRKGDSSVVDAIRGARLLDRVSELGVNLDRLESFIKLSERISSERGVEAERFVEASMGLMGLEAKTGKSYEEVVKDFEERMKRIEDLEAKAKSVQEENRKLMERKAQLEGEIREAKERRSVALQELNNIITTQERLQKLGLEKVSDLARFVEDFQLLGFDANTVRKLADWRRSLAEMGVEPDKLGDYIRERGTLKKQISELEKERRRVGGIVKKLKREHRRLFEETTLLQAEVLKLSKLGKVVKLGKIVIPCRVCGRDGVFVNLRTASEYRGMMSSGGVLQYRCFNCGQWSVYTPWEILTQVGLLAAPEQIKEAQTPLAKD